MSQIKPEIILQHDVARLTNNVSESSDETTYQFIFGYNIASFGGGIDWRLRELQAINEALKNPDLSDPGRKTLERYRKDIQDLR